MDAHERRALPEGWEWKRLGDVATVGAGNGAPQGEQYFIDGKYPFVRTQDVGREKGTICLGNTKDEINDLAVKEFNLKLWPAKTLLIPKSGESTFLNHRALLGKPSYVSSHLATIIPNNDLLPKYLYFWSLALDAKKLTHDINYPSLRLPEIESAKIPLPPLPTQRRIVSILEKAEETKRLRTQADELTDRLLKSVFMEMFGDPVRNPKGWDVKALGDVTSKIQIGPFGTQLHEEDYIDSGIPIINPTHISNKKIVEKINQTISNEKYMQLTNYHLETDDVIMGRRGDMGRCALITQRENGWMCGTGSLFIRPNKNLNSFYLLFLMSGNSMKARLENDAQGVTMPNLNLTIVNKLQIPIPPLPPQQKFARIVEKIESMHQSQNQSKQQIEDLFSALMQKAFRGEFVA